jgi:cysteine desulfurase NifS
MDPIYLDYNATTPIDPAVAREMLPYLHQHFGNPSSGHVYGQRARSAVDTARHQIADLLGCRDEEIVFTSGGTEANNYAIKGVIGALKGQGNHIITSAVEHPAVIEVCRFLEEQGARVTYLPVDEGGRVDPQQVQDAITAQTVLVTIMHANNEVGTIEPVREIADIAHRHGILMHSDCAQSIGKIPVTVDQLGVDLLSMAGHKLYAPKGIGVLYRRQGVELEKLIHGANHEMNWRAGTENVVEIVGLGEACELIRRNLTTYQEHLGQMRDRLEEGLRTHFPDLRINGRPQQRLPNTSSVSFPGVAASTLLGQMPGVAASAGAACHSDRVEVSSVLEAMGLPLELAMGTVRLSVGRYTTAAEIDRAVAEIARGVADYRSQSHTTSKVGD